MVGQVGRMGTARQQKINGNMLEQHLLTGHKFTTPVRVKADSH